MRIGYFADGPWAHKALDRILQFPSVFHVVFIVPRYDRADPVLREYSERLKIPFITGEDVNAPEFIERIRPYNADINVSMSFNQILKKDILTAAPKGFINCHAGALPFYRGRNILNWALINGEEKFAVTVHYVDEGIDTGDIILQRFAKIGPEDDYSTVLDKAIGLCAEVLPEALSLIAGGREVRTSQSSIHPVGFYCSRRKAGDEFIDWSLTSRQIHNFIRGITLPGPGARSYLNGGQIAVLSSEIIAGAPDYIDRPGTAVGRDGDGVVVKTGDNTIKITSVADILRDGGLGKSKKPDIKIGACLDVNIFRIIADMERKISALEISNGTFK